MPLPLPPTPLDAERPYFPEFRTVRRNRNELRDRYQHELDNLERNRTVGLVDGVRDCDLGLFGRFIRWEHLRTKNRIRARGIPRSGVHEYDIPGDQADDIRRSMRRVILLLRLANVASVTAQLLGLVAGIVVIMLLLAQIYGL